VVSTAQRLRQMAVVLKPRLLSQPNYNVAIQITIWVHTSAVIAQSQCRTPLGCEKSPYEVATKQHTRSYTRKLHREAVSSPAFSTEPGAAPATACLLSASMAFLSSCCADCRVLDAVSSSNTPSAIAG
jgi:hypothetical protein